MSGFNYDRAKATAERLIARFGQAMTLTVPGATTGPAWDSTPGAPVTHTCTGCVLDYSVYERNDALIQAGDRKVLLSTDGLSVVPDPAHWITVGGQDMAIIKVAPLNPGGTTVLYELQVRR